MENGVAEYAEWVVTEATAAVPANFKTSRRDQL